MRESTARKDIQKFKDAFKGRTPENYGFGRHKPNVPRYSRIAVVTASCPSSYQFFDKAAGDLVSNIDTPNTLGNIIKSIEQIILQPFTLGGLMLEATWANFAQASLLSVRIGKVDYIEKVPAYYFIRNFLPTSYNVQADKNNFMPAVWGHGDGPTLNIYHKPNDNVKVTLDIKTAPGVNMGCDCLLLGPEWSPVTGG